MTIILDMGGVLMNHNMPECITRFTAILGEEKMKTILGLASNGEGTADSLMEQYERGEVSTEYFVNTILTHAKAGTTRKDVIAAWNTIASSYLATTMICIGKISMLNTISPCLSIALHLTFCT